MAADSEVAGDIDVAISVAQGVKIAVYFAPVTEQCWIDGVNTAIHDTTNHPSVLSISWRKPEDSWSSSAINNLTIAFQEAAVLGVTVFTASGDTGTNDGTPNMASVGYPASDPWVTACGGTYIANVMGPTFTEGTWKDIDGATGGGVSKLFPLPAWQAGANVPLSVNPGNHPGRGVPDVAGNASPFSGYTIFVYGKQQSFSGTSSVAPLYAALAAIINKVADEPLGYFNPTLYALATSPGQTVFRDVADNASNSFSNGGGTSIGYASGPGWDACTGWGSINGNALLEALVINPDDPFRFGIRSGETSWLNVHDIGGDETGDDVELGNGNNADANDATVISTAASRNAAFAGQNVDKGDGCVGVFGRSQGATRSIGVAGESETGCGVYGISTGGNTIGVAGRSMGGDAVEDIPLEEVVGAPVGVLGHSTDGAGVRGHSGPLLPLGQQTPLPPGGATPGGVFSSGQLAHDWSDWGFFSHVQE